MRFSPVLFFLRAIAVALTFCSCTDEPVQPPPVKPPVHTQQDTTSHDVTWKVYRFGAGGLSYSILRDIYALNDSDVWAVGEITPEGHLEHDSLGHFKQPYNAVHWDGEEWTMHRINDVEHWPGIPRYVTIYSVRGFEGNQWVFVPLAQSKLIFYDGDTVRSVVRPHGVAKGQANKMWGTSINNLYMAGYGGSLTHYHNGTFSLIETGTEGELLDIAGTPDGHLYMAGWDSMKGIGNFLHYYNGQVNTIDKPEIHYMGDTGDPVALAVYTTEDTLYASCGAGFYVQSIRDTSHWRVIEWGNIADEFGIIDAMKGYGDNNIFAVGKYKTIMHYNGKSWKLLHEEVPNSHTWFTAVSVTEKHVYISGIDIDTGHAVVYVGTLH